MWNQMPSGSSYGSGKWLRVSLRRRWRLVGATCVEQLLEWPLLRRNRHDVLRHTAGLNAEVFDGLILMAAGSHPEMIHLGASCATRRCAPADESHKSFCRK